MADILGRGQGSPTAVLPEPRVLLVSGWDTEDPAAWSGVMVPLRTALSATLPTGTVRVTGPDHPLDKALARLSGVRGRGYLPEHSLATARRKGRLLRRLVVRERPDAVVAVACSTAVATAGLDVPVVQVTDATVRALTDYYPQFTGLSRTALWQADRLERAAQAASAAIVTTSEWAARSFIHDYGVDPEVITVAPFGPAIRPGAGSAEEMAGFCDELRRCPGHQGSGSQDSMRVLTVAADWHRKGGEEAVAAVSRLRERGCPATLTVVGAAPSGLPSWVHAAGRVPAEVLSHLYLEHDVLLELAAASAGGVTLTDAAAHGLPAVARDTGGVADIVVHGVTGFLVRGIQDTDAALEALRNPATRSEVARGAVERAHDVLDWDVWARHVARVLKGVVGRENRAGGGVLPRSTGTSRATTRDTAETARDTKDGEA